MKKKLALVVAGVMAFSTLPTAVMASGLNSTTYSATAVLKTGILSESTTSGGSITTGNSISSGNGGSSTTWTASGQVDGDEVETITTTDETDTSIKVSKTVNIAELLEAFDEGDDVSIEFDVADNYSIEVTLDSVYDVISAEDYEGVDLEVTGMLESTEDMEDLEGYDLLTDLASFEVNVLDEDGEVMEEITEFDSPVILMLATDGSGDFDEYAVLDYDEQFTPHDIYSNGDVKVMTRYQGSYFVADNEATDFDDVNNRDWFAKDVDKASAKNVVYGTSDDTFTPDSDVTADQFSMMLERSLQLTDDESDKIFEALDNANDLNREDLAYLIMAALDMAGYNTDVTVDLESMFTDASDIDEDFYSAVEVVNYYEIMVGDSKETFSPNGDVTRAQATRVLMQTLELVGYVN